MKKIVLLLAVVAAFTCAAMGAEYKVSIDCNHSSMDNTDTGNRITVYVLDGNGRNVQGKYSNGVRNCLINDAVFNFSTATPIVFVEFKTNGNDAFYIDEFRVYRNGVLISHEGRDNGRGWCLSTDPNDANGAWRNYVSGGCQSKLRFRIANSPAQPQSQNYEQQCYNMVQGRVPWNRQGNTSWSAANVQRLCRGTTNPSALVACFSRWINANTGWSQAIDICRANYNAAPTPPRNYEQECYNQVQGKVAWNRQGNTNWSQANVRRLCQGTRNPPALIACFSAWVNANTNWNSAINICRSNYNARPQRPRPTTPPEQPQPFTPKPPPPGTGMTNLGPISWDQTLPQRFRGRNQRIKVQCAANGTPRSIWGTFVYTDDSSICTAAVHAGVFTRSQGGWVVIIPRAGRSSYQGSRRNGITSGSYGTFQGSFEILGN